MENDYTLTETQPDEKWDQFVENSINGTIFSTSHYLKASGVKYKLYYCYKKAELRAGLALIENHSGQSSILDDLVIYNGVMYNQPTNKQNHAQQLSEQFKIQEFIGSELLNIYENVEMCLHPSIIDIRAFLWINYREDKPKYIPNIQYTSYVNIADFKSSSKLDEISIYHKMSSSRRQQIRYAIQKKYLTKITEDTDLLINFYQKTMMRQNLLIDSSTLERMHTLSSSLIKKQVAKIYASYDEFGEIGSMALFAWDTRRAYYLFGANDPDKRKGHTGTAVLWDAFYDLNSFGINEVDLEGVNSPKRGWFKLSFGGELLPYYNISLLHTTIIK